MPLSLYKLPSVFYGINNCSLEDQYDLINRGITVIMDQKKLDRMRPHRYLGNDCCSIEITSAVTIEGPNYRSRSGGPNPEEISEQGLVVRLRSNFRNKNCTGSGESYLYRRDS